MDTIRVVSIKSRGLNTPEKRRTLLRYMHRFRAQVVFVQETHFKMDKTPQLRDWQFPIAFHSFSLAANTKRVSILIACSAPWTLDDGKLDTQGHYVFYKGRMGATLIPFAVLYGPSLNQADFLKTTLQDLDVLRMAPWEENSILSQTRC